MKTLPMFVRCRARESGGYQCEVYLTHPNEEHQHWISDETIDLRIGR